MLPNLCVDHLRLVQFGLVEKVKGHPQLLRRGDASRSRQITQRHPVPCDQRHRSDVLGIGKYNFVVLFLINCYIARM